MSLTAAGLGRDKHADGHTFQQPRVEGHNLHDLHPVVWQNDPEPQQQEGDVFIDPSTHDVQRGDHPHHQQQRGLKAERVLAVYCSCILCDFRESLTWYIATKATNAETASFSGKRNTERQKFPLSVVQNLQELKHLRSADSSFRLIVT